MADGFEVLQDVGVLGAAEDGAVLLVDVFGSAVNACGTVRLAIPEDGPRRAARAQVERWSRQDTPLTLVVQGTTVRLLDDALALDIGSGPR